MIDSLVAGLSQNRARHLIDQGMWLAGKEGDVLTREGEPVGHLYYLAEGEAQGDEHGPPGRQLPRRRPDRRAHRALRRDRRARP